MADVKWTAAQRDAIDSGGNILVSAAAGSGKTATLSAKILKLLSDPATKADLSEFLIVTYTTAAAGELREKIGHALSDAVLRDSSLAKHISALDVADICTIHSFCFKLLRANFTSLGLAPDFSVADEAEAKLLKERAAADVIDDFMRGKLKMNDSLACDTVSLADALGKTKDSSGFDTAIITLYDRLRALGYDEEELIVNAQRLETAAELDFFASPWGEVVKAATLSAISHYEKILAPMMKRMRESEAVIKKYMPSAESVSRFMSELRKNTEYGEYEAARQTVSRVKEAVLPIAALRGAEKTDAAEEYKALKGEFISCFDRLYEKYYAATQVQTSETMLQTAAGLRGAACVIKEYAALYTELKRERSVLDFSDLELLSLKLLENPDGTPSAAALNAGKKYKYVFIDEYQDTNRVQDRIFRAVSTGSSKFFVGDIKQSIYRFRGAEPEVFSEYRRAWPENGESNTPDSGRSIFMSENFRCAEPIIDFVNHVSRHMFAYGGIPFTERDCLVYGGVSAGDFPVEVCLFGKKNAKKEESSDGRCDGDKALSPEAEYTADRIEAMLRDSSCGYKPCDIAILLRSANKYGTIYEDALKRRGIPVRRAGGSSFADESEVTLTLDILRAADNPMRDISLAGAMMSSVFGFSLDELVRIRMNDSETPLYTSVLRCADGEGELAEKCTVFIDRLGKLRASERGMAADRFIEYMYSELNLFSAPEVREKLCGEANLRLLHDMARSYEKGVYGGLYGFLSFIDEKLEGGSLSADSALSSDSQAVTIISIHKSKGLEFPVCFLCECGHERNESDERGRLLLSRELGVGMLLPDPSGLVLCGNPVRSAIAAQTALCGAREEMRVLYVALTRARERLIITARFPRRSVEAELADIRYGVKYTDEYTVTRAKRMIDLILQADAVIDGGICKLILPESERNAAEEIGENEENIILSDEILCVNGNSSTTFGNLSADKLAQIRDSIAFEYPYKYLENIPSKFAVSALYPELLDEPYSEEGVTPSVLTDRTDNSDEPLEPEQPSQEMPYPRFMSGTTDTDPAERGTSTHVVLQFADFPSLSRSVKDELDRLVKIGFITERMASLVNKKQVEQFARSDLMEEIMSAAMVKREFRFNVLLPAADFTADPELREKLCEGGESITVQGVFDCVYESNDGRLVLVDYKTDSMSASELRSPELGEEKLKRRHSMQLSYYAKACRLIFGRRPDEIYIYSLALGRKIPLSQDDLQCEI
ncbi:MAG: UvrD-helicase domain-containing protein [Clostridiales bacterium]|nr:UvrD-helicase domain-containing protein [Clostridiales bacterium]